MPIYYYQYNFKTEDFERNINNQIPVGDSVSSINSTFCPIMSIDAPSTSENDLDEYMSTQGFSRVQPSEPPTDQVALGEIQLNPSTAPISQRVGRTSVKTTLWNLNSQDTVGIITPDQANNEIVMNTLFNSDTGDRYDFNVSMSVSIPFRTGIIFEIIHNDDGIENTISTFRCEGLIFDSPIGVSMNGSFKINSATNQSVYLNIKTLSGNANINYYSGNAILKRF